MVCCSDERPVFQLKRCAAKDHSPRTARARPGPRAVVAAMRPKLTPASADVPTSAGVAASAYVAARIMHFIPSEMVNLIERL